MRRLWQRRWLAGLLLLAVALAGWGVNRKYQYYRQIEDAQWHAGGQWLQQQTGYLINMDTHLTRALLEQDFALRNEALQAAVTTAESAYALLTVIPLPGPWRDDFIRKNSYHYPWGPIIDYLTYASQLQGPLPVETRSTLYELRQWSITTKERAKTLMNLAYGPGWRRAKDKPVVQEAFNSWLEPMSLLAVGELDEAYQKARATPSQRWPGLRASHEAEITKAEAMARVNEFLFYAGFAAAKELEMRSVKGSGSTGYFWYVTVATQSPATILTLSISHIGGHVVDVQASLPMTDLQLLTQLSRDLASAWAQMEGEEMIPYRYHLGSTIYETEFVVLRQDIPLQSRKILSYFTSTGQAVNIRLLLDRYFDKYPLPLDLVAPKNAEEILNSLDPQLVASGPPRLTMVEGRGYQERLAYVVPLAEMPGVGYVYIDAETGAFLGREPGAEEDKQWEYAQEWLDLAP
ncbi:MAG: hypothetical protein GX060_02720 [Firmicutes bacterium]|nr:hypothetical protein [Bacillota bacterium]